MLGILSLSNVAALLLTLMSVNLDSNFMVTRLTRLGVGIFVLLSSLVLIAGAFSFATNARKVYRAEQSSLSFVAESEQFEESFNDVGDFSIHALSEVPFLNAIISLLFISLSPFFILRSAIFRSVPKFVDLVLVFHLDLPPPSARLI